VNLYPEALKFRLGALWRRPRRRPVSEPTKGFHSEGVADGSLAVCEIRIELRTPFREGAQSKPQRQARQEIHSWGQDQGAIASRKWMLT
jgi:hypothetical protein